MARVVLIEDEALMARPVVDILVDYGHEVKTFTHGRTALKELASPSQHVDVLLLDLGLPDIDGFDMLCSFQQISRAPVIVLTSLDNETAVALALEKGAVDYIRKPFTRLEGVARVEAALRRTVTQPAPAHEPRKCGPLVIDRARHVCEWNGKTVELGRAQLECLWILADDPTRPKPRDALKRATGVEYIDGVIRELRDTFGDDTIINVHGIGWRLGDAFLVS